MKAYSKGFSSMTADSSKTPNLTDLRDKLLAQRAELLVRTAHERGGVMSRAEVAAAHYDTAASDNAQLRTERETEFAVSEHETAELVEIERALEQMRRADYGHCIDCKASIPMLRLLAAPTALRCIACQASHESHHAIT
jgi:DnaK suppressor protein